MTTRDFLQQLSIGALLLLPLMMASGTQPLAEAHGTEMPPAEYVRWVAVACAASASIAFSCWRRLLRRARDEARLVWSDGRLRLTMQGVEAAARESAPPLVYALALQRLSKRSGLTDTRQARRLQVSHTLYEARCAAMDTAERSRETFRALIALTVLATSFAVLGNFL